MVNENSILATTGVAAAKAEKEKSDRKGNAMAAALTELLFVLLPLFVIGIVFAFRGRMHELFFIPEWALAASVVSGQAVTKFVKYTIGAPVHKERVTFAVAFIIFFLLVPSLVVLSLILAAERVSLALSVSQAVLFVVSSFVFFLATYLEVDPD